MAQKRLNEIGWHRTCIELHGRSDIPPNIADINHRAAPVLNRIRRNGVSVVLATEPWHPDLLEKRLHRGPHNSSHEYIDFLGEEFLDFCQKGFWMILPYDDVKHLPGLHLSPLGVVPQRERRPRIIVDYTFYGLNGDTIKISTSDSMQFGKANEQLLQRLVHSNPKFGPCSMYKLDIADGFYRVPLTTSGVLKLGVVLPKFPGQPPLIAFPLVLPMGWTESPPFFCYFTETACDMANADLRKNIRHPPHHLEAQAGALDGRPNPIRGHDDYPVRPTPKSHCPHLRTKPTAYVDVFVDDFMGLGQDHGMNDLQNQRRTLMHNIDKVFRPLDLGDSKYRKEPISASKLDKGDAAWQDVKRCLGWDYAAKSKNLLVAPHRKEKVTDALVDAIGRKRLGLKAWQVLLGQLHSLVIGIPGSEGQFSLLQAALTATSDNHIRVSAAVRQQLETFLDLLDDEHRPAHMEELVAGDPVHIGACDAAKMGMGGVWFTDDGRALLWREPFSAAIQQALISYDNPTGTLTNSDLELAGTIMHQAVLADHAVVLGETAHTLCDNTPAVAWRDSGSSTTTAAHAYLLRLAALQRKKQRCNHRISHISGEDNRMADDASRLWNLSDAELLTHFNSTYPQKQSWELCPTSRQLSSVLTSMLSQSRSRTECALRVLSKDKTPGRSGLSSVLPSTPIQDSATLLIPSPSCSSLQDVSVTDDLHPKGSRSVLDMLKMPYGRWARHFPQWGPLTPG